MLANEESERLCSEKSAERTVERRRGTENKYIK